MTDHTQHDTGASNRLVLEWRQTSDEAHVEEMTHTYEGHNKEDTERKREGGCLSRQMNSIAKRR